MSSVTMLDIDKICRVCLRCELDMNLIFESEDSPTISEMLGELTIYKIKRFDDLPQLICSDCLNVVLSAYQLKQQCEQSYRTLMGLLNCEKDDSEVSRYFTKDLLEKSTQTDESSLYPCERCEEKFFTYGSLRLHRQTAHKGGAIICRFCSRSFDRIGYLKTHLAVFHPETGYKSHNQCHICLRQFTRREHFRRHLKAVHKIEDYVLETSREEDSIKEKSPKNAEEKLEITVEELEESESEKELYSLWQEDTLENLTEDEKHLENLMDNTATSSHTIDVDEIEKPLADLLNYSASSAQSIEDVLNESLIENDNMTENVTPKKSLIVKQKAKIVQDILHPPKRTRGRPPKKPPNCKYCDKSYNDPSMLQQHVIEDHLKAQDFPCKICGDQFTSEEDFNNHLNTNHSDVVDKQLLNCDQCNKSFADTSQYKIHKESHTNKLYQCSKCEKSFCTKNSLQRHLDNHEKKRYVCKECSQGFLTRKELSNHAKVDGHDKPLLCPECGLRCKTSNIFTVHMRRHNGEKPFKCKFCSKGFPRMDDLRIHEKYHTGEKSHFCEICGKGFLRKYNLRIHLRVHTGEKPYKCPHCPQAFAQGNDLKAHIRRHTGERFRCGICGAAFLQAYQIRQHKLQEHDIHEVPPTQRVKKFTSPEEQEKQIKQNLQNE